MEAIEGHGRLGQVLTDVGIRPRHVDIDRCYGLGAAPVVKQVVNEAGHRGLILPLRQGDDDGVTRKTDMSMALSELLEKWEAFSTSG